MNRKGEGLWDHMGGAILLVVILLVVVGVIYVIVTNSNKDLKSFNNCDGGGLALASGPGSVCKCFDNPRCDGDANVKPGYWGLMETQPYDGEKAWKWNFIGKDAFGCPPEKEKGESAEDVKKKTEYIYACITMPEGQQFSLAATTAAACEQTPAGTWKFVRPVQDTVTCLPLEKTTEIGVAPGEQFGFRYFFKQGESTCKISVKSITRFGVGEEPNTNPPVSNGEKECTNGIATFKYLAEVTNADFPNGGSMTVELSAGSAPVKTITVKII